MAGCSLSLSLASIQSEHGNPKPMGLGAIGSGQVVFKRKFRWTFEIEYCCDSGPFKVAKEFVKVGSRPQIDIEETEINYLHGKMWIPGKATWQTLSVTYYDITGNTGSINTLGLFGWIASIYDICNSTSLFMGSRLNSYEGQARLILWDGCGQPLEGWLLRHVWPQSINWGDLDMSSSEECTVELTLRYSEVEYRSYCGGTFQKCPCAGCPTLSEALGCSGE